MSTVEVDRDLRNLTDEELVQYTFTRTFESPLITELALRLEARLNEEDDGDNP